MRVNVTIRGTLRSAARGVVLAHGIVLAALVAPGHASAQAGLTHTGDAATVPRGMLRFTALPSWARYDSRFTGTGGTEPLGAVLTSESLGTEQIPALTAFEASLRSLTGDPTLRLSLGRALTTSSVRVVTTPLTLEYGLTRRFSLGVTVPIVQRSRELILDIDVRGPLATGNVGPVGTARLAAMYAQAGQLASALDAAAAALAARIAQCTAQPSSSGCGAINADLPGANATFAAARDVAASVRFVYGTSATDPGLGLVPLATLSPAIEATLQGLNTRFASYLGTAPLSTTAAPAGALGAASAENVRTLARAGGAGIGPDSLGRVAKIGIGDVELAARFLLWDTAPVTTPTAGGRLRVTLGAVARLGTGEAASDDELFVVGAGDGQTDAEGSIAVDYDGPRRFGVGAVARYTAQFGSVAATRVADARGSLTPFGARGSGTRTLGNILALEASPRYRLGNALYVSGHYAFLRRGADRYAFPQSALVDPAPWPPSFPPIPATATAGAYSEQRAGFGVTYSTFDDWERGTVRLPIEVRYVHLQTVSGSNAAVPRASRDQIQLRLYYRLRR